jgi:YD repeat-containing protein
MNKNKRKQINFKNIGLLLVALLSFSLYTFPAHAVTESIQYNNDNARQITNVTYDDGTDVTYIYDTSGNRRSKTIDLLGTTNNPPSEPAKQSPSDSEQDVDLTVDLSWTASSDPDTGDTMVYDIYLGTSSSPPLYRSGYSLTNLTTLPLESFITYYWKVVARDNHGGIAEGTEWNFTTIYVTTPPIADPGGFYYEVEGQTIILDGSGSTADSTKTITLYEWDIDNDGNYDYSNSSPTQSHPYAQQGTYTIKLRVTDEEAATDEALTSAIVSDSSPIVTFTANVTSGTEPLTVNFEDTSIVHDAPPDRYWDFGDGGRSSYFPNRQYTYNQNGTFTVELLLRDSDYSVESGTTIITVNDSAPTAAFTADVTNGSTPLAVTFINNSTGHDQPLTYEWDFDNNGSTDSTDLEPLYIFTIPGIYTVKLTVTDNDGSTNSLNRTDYIMVCYPPANLAGDSTAYSLLQSAYDAAPDNGTIQIRNLTFTENININRPVSVKMEGGYDCLHTPTRGTTTIEGDMNISDGTVETESIVIAK